MYKYSFAIIGGGPAAFYTSKLLSRLSFEPFVHIFEKQLCPFGLIRYGVAPDHISIKKSEETLSEIKDYPFFKYFGNVHVKGSDLISLKKKYSGIIYAYGANQNHVPSWLNKNQNNKNIKFARDLVYWYNGHPDKQNTHQNLQKVRNVVIIGNGNVAIDVARVLMRKTQQLQQTQISKLALQQLKKANIENIEIIGRRGVTHSAFSIKQIRELNKLGFQLYAIEEQLQESMTPASRAECTAIGDHFNSIVRMNKRKIDFIREKFHIIKEDEISGQKKKSGKKIFFRYLLNPVEVKQNQILFDKSFLSGDAFAQKINSKNISTQVSFDLLLISTGFEVSPINHEQFDEKNKKVHHSNGCVVNSDGKVDIGSYAVGWCKNGPRGVLDQTLNSCQETVNNLRIHVQNGLLKKKIEPSSPQNFVSFEKYQQVKRLQLQRGNKSKFIKSKMMNSELSIFYGLQTQKKIDIQN